MKLQMNSIDYNTVIDILFKVGIVIIVLIIIYMVFKCFSCIFGNGSKKSSKSNSKIGSESIPPPPHIPFFGRSKSETLAINAFAAVLYEKGHDWRQIKVGYRHECMKNPLSGRCLELDAYAIDIKIAIEYNGIQHYEFPNPFHKDRESFEQGVERDRLKRELCREHGIKLIEIPYYIDTCDRSYIDGDRNCGDGWKYIKNTNEDKWNRLKKFIEDRI